MGHGFPESRNPNGFQKIPNPLFSSHAKAKKRGCQSLISLLLPPFLSHTRSNLLTFRLSPSPSPSPSPLPSPWLVAPSPSPSSCFCSISCFFRNVAKTKGTRKPNSRSIEDNPGVKVPN